MKYRITERVHVSQTIDGEPVNTDLQADDLVDCTHVVAPVLPLLVGRGIALPQPSRAHRAKE